MWQSISELILTSWLMLVLVFSGEATLPNTAEQEPAADTPTPVARETAVVTRVIDGDTIIIDSGERVRLLGIDTPEQDECYFEEARDYLAWWLDRGQVVLESDGRDKDDYGRLLRYVFTNREWGGPATTTELFVNEALVQEGYARILPIGNARRYREDLAASEEAARADGAGRWTACTSS